MSSFIMHILVFFNLSHWILNNIYWMMNLTHSEFSLSLQNCYLKVRNYILRCIDNCQPFRNWQVWEGFCYGALEVAGASGILGSLWILCQPQHPVPNEKHRTIVLPCLFENYSGVLKSASLLVYLSCLPDTYSRLVNCLSLSYPNCDLLRVMHF